MAITRDDWLKALSDAGVGIDVADDQSALTVKEFADMMACSTQRAAQRLSALTAAGKAVRTTKRITATDGRRLTVRAFTLTP